MCLARAVVAETGAEPVFSDIARIKVYSGRVEMENLFGEVKIVNGNVTAIDFMKSEILLSGGGG